MNTMERDESLRWACLGEKKIARRNNSMEMEINAN